MDKQSKIELAEKLNEKFNRSNAAFIAEYRGMPVPLLEQLRVKVREGNGELHVLKNRVARFAAKGTALEDFAKNFKGPIAIALSYKDSVSVAKAILECVNEESPLRLRVASLDGKNLTEADVKALSKLPDRQTLLTMVASVLQAPVRNFACVMAAVPRDFVNVLTAVKRQKDSQ